MAELQIAGLGDFRVTVDGTVLTVFPTGKSRALLAYLFMEGRLHQRSELAQFLWPGYGDESARNSLRQALHQVRQLLQDADVDPPWLVITRQTVQINPAASIQVDVTRFQQLLAACAAHDHPALTACAPCLARLRQAVDLYRGDFLAGFTVDDSDEFEEWRRITQEQLHVQMLDALAQLAAAAEAAGESEDALQVARRQLTLEPWLEEAHRRIMRLLAQQGQSAAALAQYQICRQVLAAELSAEPDAETAALYEQIRTGRFDRVTRRQGDKEIRPQGEGETGLVLEGSGRDKVTSPSPITPLPTPPIPHTLTPPTNPLLGRDAELAQIATLLAQPNCRLVTLVGPPGVGKTRLAQEVLDLRLTIDDLHGNSVGANDDAPVDADVPGNPKSKIVNQKFAHGVHFVDLSALRDPALLAATIAQDLSASAHDLQITGERLVEQLRDKALLLVLDNFEHLLPGATLLGQLLAQCPHLKLLLTSRVPLHLPGEQVVTVQPLPLPQRTQPITLTIAMQNEAVQLFCQRAAAVVPGFALTESLAPVVVEICRCLDGLPLAIELAAARSRLLPPAALLERLRPVLPTRLELLATRAQGVPARQQTLRAAIAWSYDLLAADEQRLFRQLTVFVGGATLTAIEAVIGAGPGAAGARSNAPPVAADAILAGIEALLDKNLLRQQEIPAAYPDSEPRVILLETLREFGWEQLTTAADAPDNRASLQQRHADYFLTLAETAAPKLHGSEQVAWLDRLALEHDNVRAALDWLAQAGELEKALRLATALRYFWRVRGHYREGSARLQQLLARPEAAATGSPADAVRARALNAAGYLQWVQGNTAVAQSLLQAALPLGRAVPDPAATAFALRYLGLAADAQQDGTTARRYLEESLAIYRSLDAPNETALALMYLGDMALGQQSYDQAQQLYQESAGLLRQLGNQVVLPYALRHLGYLALIHSNLAEALRLCTESLRLNVAAGEQQGSVAALSALAAVAVAGERWSQATRLLECVTTWLAASQARLLPFDHTYYTETQRQLQQHQSTTANNAPAPATAPLTLEQALAYVVQELTFAERPALPGQQGDKETRRQGDKEKGGSDGAFSLSPPLPVSSSPVTPHNLPLPATPLVGRSRSLAEISAQLQQASTRLLTLIGPGGMGKTRLALEAGRQHLATFADGVWFIPLASISRPEALAGAIATALGLAVQGGDPRNTLLQSLRPKQLLLILDNFEHLLVAEAEGAVALVVDLLNAAPGMQILVTSRERLNLRSEHLYAVPALSFAPNATLAEAEALAAVRLFVQAVQRVQADFQLTDANLATVLRICQLVEGMPLGLELAAAQAGELPLAALAAAVAESAEVLTVNWRDLPARQRSMRAVFAWSWQLLTPAEQRALCQMSIFRSGFDSTAAQAVTGSTPLLLTRLINKSLLQRQETTSGAVRYFLHELLRQFAAEELTASGEQVLVAAQHGRYYLAYLAARGLRLGRHEPKEASAEIQGELDNVRLAWQWAATQGEMAALDQATYAWWQFCQFQGLETEGEESFAAAIVGVRQHLARSTGDDARVGQRLLATLLAIHVNFLFARGREQEMVVEAREAIELGIASGNVEGETFGTFVLGRAMQELGQPHEAEALWQRTIALVRQHRPNQPASEMLHEADWMAHNWLRHIAFKDGDYAGSRAWVTQALQICQALGKRRAELSCLSNLAYTNLLLCDFAAAEVDLAATLELARRLGYRRVEMYALEGQGQVLRLRGDYISARNLLEQAVSMTTAMALPYDEALILARLIRLHYQLGNPAAAAEHYQRLTHLLERSKLPKECQLYGYLVAAIKAHHADDKPAALRYAEQANQLIERGDILFRVIDTALIVGQMHAANAHWQPAITAYRQALAGLQQLAGGHWTRVVAAEAQAGLAQIALAQGDLAGAQAQVEALLPILAEEPHAGYNDPFFIYLTGYRVLAANGDPRAATLLKQGYDLLQQDAAALDDESRQRFLTAVPVHRELVAAYTKMQAQRDMANPVGVTSDKVTSDKVTESPPHLATLSPPHLVTLSSKHNLPATLTPFVGRTRSLAEIRSRLEQGVRLLTLIGPGGTGKTRLAVEAGRQQVAAYPDGVWFVPLAALTNPDALAPAIATALNLPISGGDLGAALAQLLQPKRLLLILDNFEQLLVESTAGAELVAALLQAAPGVQILVTSRERLQLRSEQLYQVPPLTVDLNATLDEATTASAARLFVQSAQFVQPNFQLTDANLATVLRICHLVQGMPLGLELAAAQVGSLPLAAIADAIAQSAEFLAVDWVDLPERQRSMRAVFAWSWRLLNEAEQRALRQLSIFRGGFTHEAAQAITGVTLATLTRLVHCSLLSWEEQGAGGRYAIHEQLRQFAAEELTQVAPEEEQVTARYNEFYLHYLAAREARLTRAEPRAAAAEIQWELDNIRQAWQNTVQRLAFSALQRSAWALFSFYRHTGSSSEALQSFQALAEQILRPVQPGFAWGPRQPHDPPQSRFVAIYAYLLTLQSKLDQAIVVAQQALALAQAEEATDAAALSHLSWGQALRLQGRLAEAQPHLEQTLQLGRSVTDPTGKSDLLYDVECLAGNALGALASDGGNYQQAREHFGRSLHLAQSLGKRRLEINALLNLANLARMAGEYPAARQGYEDALRLTRTVGYRWGEGISQYELGQVLRKQGEYSQAATLLENVLLIFQEIGEHFRKGSVLIALGQLYAYLGDVTAAEGWLTRYQQFIDQTQVREATIHYLHACTALAFHREDLVQALAYATEGWQLGQSQRLPDIQAYGLIGIGHAQRQLGQVAAATSAYQQALDLYTTLQRPDLAAEAQAGLAAIAQQQGDLRQALGLVATVLAQLAEQPSSGQDEPFFLYLTCYQVLAAAQDARASTILEQGYHLLQRYTEQISDDQLRQSFLENVPIHRALQQAYRDKETRRQGDRETRRQGDRETTGQVESHLQPLFPSPPLPLPLSALYDWAEMPVVDFFVERTAEVAQLTAWLTPGATGVPARLISILGMGGMGKTTLAAAVTKALAPSFAVVIWRSLLNAPPLNELVRNWLQVLSRQTLTALPDALDEQLRLLLTYLQKERCLLVLDNVESIFATDAQSRAGVMRSGYEGYDQLLQRLATSDHQSCLLLTSREQPYALLRPGRQAQTTGGRIRLLPLSGLDQTAGHALLQSNGLYTTTVEAAQLIDNYSGNPLALQIVAATIADFFGGDVAAFWQAEGHLFDGMRVVLDQQFARLSALEQEILVWLAIEREPINIQTLRANLVQPVPTSELLEALQALQNRSLLEKRGPNFTLQNVIIEYTTEYLVREVCEEIAAGGRPGPEGTLEYSAFRLPPAALNRFALLKAQAKEYVRQSQARLILRPVADRLVATLGRAQLLTRIPQVLNQLRTAGVQKGYAGGNLLNLLVQLGEDLVSYDFSRLPVWQADLSGLTFAAANFTGADLEGCTFTAGIKVDRIAFQPTDELWVAGVHYGALGIWRTRNGQLLDALWRESNQRGRLVFSPDGQFIATMADNYCITIWSTTTGECLQTLPGHQGAVYTLAVSGDGARLASWGSDQVVCLWDLHQGHCYQRLAGYEQGADALAFSPDGQWLATGGGDGMIKIWDVHCTATAGRQLAAWQAHPHPLGALVFSPDGGWLASGSHAGEIRLWQVEPRPTAQSGDAAGAEPPPVQVRAGQHFEGHTSIIRALLFLPASAPATYLLASGSADRTVRIWSLTGQVRYTLLGHTNAVHSLSARSDGQQLASSGSDQQIFLWDVNTGQALNALQAYRSAINCIAFSPDGQMVASGSADHIVRLWQVDNADELASPVDAASEQQAERENPIQSSQICHFLRGHTHFISSVAFSPDGQIVASGDADRTIRLWDRASGQAWQVLRAHQGSVRALAFAPTPSPFAQAELLSLASAGADRIIRLWSVASRPRSEARCRRQLIGHDDEILTVTFDPSGRRLISGCADGSIRIWDVASSATLQQLTGHTAPITTVAISPDGNTLASSCYDQTIRLWNVATGACLHVARGSQIGTNALAFSADGEYLAYTGNDYVIYLWQWRTYATASALPPEPLRGHVSEIYALSFSPTAPLLASCSINGTLRIWDIERKRCRQILRPPGPYAGMKITGVTGISEAQKAALRALGAVEG